MLFQSTPFSPFSSYHSSVPFRTSKIKTYTNDKLYLHFSIHPTTSNFTSNSKTQLPPFSRAIHPHHNISSAMALVLCGVYVSPGYLFRNKTFTDISCSLCSSFCLMYLTIYLSENCMHRCFPHYTSTWCVPWRMSFVVCVCLYAPEVCGCAHFSIIDYLMTFWWLMLCKCIQWIIVGEKRMNTHRREEHLANDLCLDINFLFRLLSRHTIMQNTLRRRNRFTGCLLVKLYGPFFVVGVFNSA